MNSDIQSVLPDASSNTHQVPEPLSRTLASEQIPSPSMQHIQKQTDHTTDDWNSKYSGNSRLNITQMAPCLLRGPLGAEDGTENQARYDGNMTANLTAHSDQLQTDLNILKNKRQANNHTDLTVYTGLNSSMAHQNQSQATGQMPFPNAAVGVNESLIQFQNAQQMQLIQEYVIQQSLTQSTKDKMEKPKVLKTLKPVKPRGNGAAPAESALADDQERTEFYVWGTDKYGQLGQNVSKKLFTVPRFCLFKGAERVLKVSCGDSHSALLTQDGLLYTFGSSQGGKLGLRSQGSNSEIRVPALVEDLLFGTDADGSHRNKVRDVCCANSFTLATTAGGQAYSWGTNLYGALALGKQATAVNKPMLIQSLAQYQAHIVKVSSKSNHSIFLDALGQVYMSGKGEKGQLGLNIDAIRNNGHDEQCIYYPNLIQSIKEKIVDIQAGKDFSLLLTASREVIACGSNSQGQLGLGDTQEAHSEPTKIPILKDVRKIECNEGSIALDSKGQMFVWGPISKDKSLIIPTKVQSLPDQIVDCSIGKYTYAAIDEKQMVWVWGDNKQAQLGLSDYTPRHTPYPLLQLKDKQIDQISFGQNFSIAISRYPKIQQADSANLVTLANNQENLLNDYQNSGRIPSSSPMFSNLQSNQNLQQTPLFHQPNPYQYYSQNLNQQHQDSGAQVGINVDPLTFQSPNFARSHQSQIIEGPNQRAMGPGQHAQQYNNQTELRSNIENMQNPGNSRNHEYSGPGNPNGVLTNDNPQTSYVTPSNYNLLSQCTHGGDLSSAYQTNASQMYQHPVIPSMPLIAPSQLSNFGSKNGLAQQPSDKDNFDRMRQEYLREDTQEDNPGTLRSITNHHGAKDYTVEVQGKQYHHGGVASASNTGTYRSQLNHPGDSSVHKDGPSTKTLTDYQTRTHRNKEMQIEDYESHLEQMDILAQQYEKEMNALRASNHEQAQDLHTMIQTVNEMKDQQAQLQNQLEDKDKERETLKQEHARKIQELKKQNEDVLSNQIEQIDFLTKKIEELEDQFKGPKNKYLQEIEEKTQEIQQLSGQVQQKQRDLIQMNSDYQRLELQVQSLNSKISDLEVECSELRCNQNQGSIDQEKNQLLQNLDLQKNLNRCQQLTIEKLENRIIGLEAGRTEEAKNDQQNALEKAQLQRKVTSLENQLRFQTNLNEETKREIVKLDSEISQVANNCSNREQILQQKLEDVHELLRKERVQGAALKSEMMQKENQVEKLKTNLRSQNAEIKLAQLENEALMKQQEYDRSHFTKLMKENNQNAANRSPQNVFQTVRNVQIPAPARADRMEDSYLDMSYSQSPSMVQHKASVDRQYRTQRETYKSAQSDTAPADPALYDFTKVDKLGQQKRLDSYNQQLLKSIQRKTMGPLFTNYHDDTARKQRRARSITGPTIESEGPAPSEAAKANEEDGRRQRGGSAHRKQGDDQENDFSLNHETRRYNQVLGSNMDKLMGGGTGQVANTGNQGRPESGYKRTKSADPNTSHGSQKAEKEPTYIQKLLKLNSTAGNGPTSHPFNVPPWQSLLKGRQQALRAENRFPSIRSVSAKYDNVGERNRSNSLQRRLSYQNSNNSNGNVQPAQNTHEAVSVRDIGDYSNLGSINPAGDDSINARDTSQTMQLGSLERPPTSSINANRALERIHSDQTFSPPREATTLDTRQSVRNQQHIGRW